ncbi:MAG: hypothetical protein WC533_04315 [Candidatus Pacearchaeota archaeon]
MNNKAGMEIGSTLTWIVATVIISFMMLLYIAGSFWIAKNLSSDEIIAEEEAGSDIAVIKNIQFFIDENKNLISAWADDKRFYGGEYYSDSEECKDAKEGYDNLCSAIHKYTDIFQHPNYKFCIENVGEQGKENIFVLKDSQGCLTSQTLCLNEPTGEYREARKILLGTSKGNQVNIYFYNGK